MNNIDTTSAPSTNAGARNAHTLADTPEFTDILDQANGDSELSYILIDADGDGKIDHLMFSTGGGRYRLEVLNDEYEARAS